VLLPVQLFSLGWVMDRWQSGIGPRHTLNPLLGSWHPVTGSALPLVLMTAGLVGFGWLAWRAANLAGDEHPLAAGQPSAELRSAPVARGTQPGLTSPISWPVITSRSRKEERAGEGRGPATI
jgi:hypothetical protein